MTTRFLLVRHGQTAWNKDIRFRGTTDLSLSEVGLAQAQRVADWLRDEPIQAIYSSPLTRALQTAQPLADALRLPVQIRRGLISVDYGKWQGLTPQEVSERWPDLYRTWQQSPHLVTFPGGESLQIALNRGVEMLDELCEKHPDQTVALFSHEIVTKTLMGYMLGLDNSAHWRIPQDNGCINAFSYGPSHRSLIYLNDTCHMRKPAQT